MDNFGSHSGNCFSVSLIVVGLYSNLFKKLGKSEMKNWNLHFNLSNPKKKITKRINVQFKVNFTKDGTSNVTIQTTLKKLSLWIFFSSKIGNQTYNVLPPHIEVP
jgi:hypothetical protein